MSLPLRAEPLRVPGGYPRAGNKVWSWIKVACSSSPPTAAAAPLRTRAPRVCTGRRKSLREPGSWACRPGGI